MPTNTSNLNLTVYDLSEINERFIDFRNNLAGNSNSNMTKIDAAVAGKQPKIYSGTSATAAATSAKTVTINGGSYIPTIGDILAIKFTSGNTAASATLAVNADLARAIQLNGVALSTEFGTISANGILMLYFDGTNYQMFGSQKTSASVSWTNVTSKPSPVITLGGDLTGSVTLTNVGNGTLTATVVDDSHNHTIATVTGLQTALDGKQASLGFTPENSANKGTANGYAELDATGKVPAAQLPSFVDDVLEYANLASFPATGETGKIYVDIATNTTYRWSGTVYVAIGSSLALGETSTTAYRGDRGKIAYDHSQVAHAPASAQVNQTITAGAGMNFVATSGDITVVMGTPSTLTTGTTNSASGTTHTHAVTFPVTSVAGKTGAVTLTASDVGLGNVTNESKATMFTNAALTGTPTGTTAAVGTNTTQLATTAFVNAEIANDAAPIAHVGATGTAHGVATVSVNGFMSSADKTKLDGIATGANNYVHPITDGNLHVPATSTTNNGKALIAGATAGSFAWTTLTASMVGLGNVTNESKATMFTSPTFTGNLPILPASNPTTDNQAVRKAYVDLATDLVRPNYTVEYITANSRFEIGTYDAGWTTFTALATVPVVGNKIAIYLDPRSQTEEMFSDQTSIYAADGTSFVIAVSEPNNDYGFDIYGPTILNLEFKMGAQVGNFFYNKLTGYITSSLTSRISPRSVIGPVNGFPNLDLLSNLEWINTSFAKLNSPAFTGTPTATTASAGTNTTQIATTAYVQGEASASAILTKIKTVDGASSGLDADLLDGQQGSYYAPFILPNGVALRGYLTDGTTARSLISLSSGNDLALGSTTIKTTFYTNGELKHYNGTYTSDVCWFRNAATGGQFDTSTTAPTATNRLNYGGYLYATRIYSAVFNDLAEYMTFKPGENLKPGDPLSSTKDGLVKAKFGDKNVVGVYSDTYGYALGAEDKETKVPVGISGRVLIRIENDNLLEPGQLVVAGNESCLVHTDEEKEPRKGTVLGKVFDGVKQEDGRYWMIIALM